MLASNSVIISELPWSLKCPDCLTLSYFVLIVSFYMISLNYTNRRY